MDDSNNDKILDVDLNAFADINEPTDEDIFSDPNEDLLQDLTIPDLDLENLVLNNSNNTKPEPTPTMKEEEQSLVDLDLNSTLADDPLLDLESEESEPITKDSNDEEEDEPLKYKELLKNILIIGAIILVILMIWALVKSKGNNQSENLPSDADVVSSNEQISAQPNQLNVGLYEIPTLSYDATTYTDYLVINKAVMTWDNTLHPIIYGTTTKSKINVKILVTLETYNSLESGQILSIYYNDIELNEQHYATNFTLGEVVGQ